MAVDPGLGVRTEPGDGSALDDRGVVMVRGEHPARARGVSAPDHVEERLLGRPPVHRPGGVEYLVPAVLGVRLGEHHELRVGRVAAERAEPFTEPAGLVLAEREPEAAVRIAKDMLGVVPQGDPGDRTGGGVAEEIRGNRETAGAAAGSRALNRRLGEQGEAFGHAVIQRPE